MLVHVVVSSDSGPLSFDVDPLDAVENLMVLIEVETGIAVSHQRLFFQGRPLNPNKTFASQGVNADASRIDLKQVPSHATQQPQPAASADDLITRLFQSPAAEKPVGAAAPPFALPPQSTPAPPPATADEAILQLFQRGAAAAPAPAPIPVDPDDPEVQRRLYEAIQKQNLEENLVQAMEHTPEAFARVVMLYVPCTVNRVPITAFVDSGAQMSIMSERMAERCGILRLLDRRMAGVAKGVGTCKILGRVHMAMVTLGSLVLPFSITVLERQDMDFLIGLDQLKRHQMLIDLKHNCLRIDTECIPFLGEGDLPPHLCDETRGEGSTWDEQKPPHPQVAGDGPTGGAPGAVGTHSSALPSSHSHAAGAAAAATPPLAHTNPQLPQHQDPEYEAKVHRLLELAGITNREVVDNALQAAGGDENVAATILFGVE